MSKTLLTLVLSIAFFSAFSQQDSLLKNFKYRIDRYQAINFTVGGAGSLSNYDDGFHSINNHSSGGNFGGNFYSVKSTGRILLTTTANLGTSLNIDKSKSTGATNKNTTLSVAPGITVLNKWFSKNKFTELGAELYSYGYSNKISSDGALYNLDKQGQYNIVFNTGIGKGRLENVTDMQNALWLSKALTTENTLSRSLSDEELNELGRTITKANNTRVLDARKRTQFMLETVDNYLQQKGLINKTDIRYFSNLNDILFFAFNSPRLSGTEKFIRLKPGISAYGTRQKQSYNVSKSDHVATSKSLALSTGINKYNPTNLVHQNNYGAAVILSYNSLDFTEKYTAAGSTPINAKTNTILKQAGVNLFYEHAIYPNTRTTINFNLQAQAGYQAQETVTSFYHSTNLAGSVNYFISYRTRLTCSVGTVYQQNVYNTSPYLYLSPSNFQLYASAGIGISL
jgi:hypothetical protein